MWRSAFMDVPAESSSLLSLKLFRFEMRFTMELLLENLTMCLFIVCERQNLHQILLEWIIERSMQTNVCVCIVFISNFSKNKLHACSSRINGPLCPHPAALSNPIFSHVYPKWIWYIKIMICSLLFGTNRPKW